MEFGISFEDWFWSRLHENGRQLIADAKGLLSVEG